MTFYALTGLINAIIALVFGSFGYWTNRGRFINKLFGLMNLAVAIWSIGYWLWLSADLYVSALFWVYILTLGSVWIPILYLHWIITLLGQNKTQKIAIYSGYVLTLFFTFLTLNSSMVSGLEKELFFTYWPKGTIWYLMYIIVLYLGVSGYGLILLIRSYKYVQGHIRSQVKYLIFGSLIGFGGGITNFPMWFGFSFPPYTNILVSLYVLIFGYAMFKYRLMDIRFVVRRAFVYFGLGVFVVGAYYLVAWSDYTSFGGPFTWGALLTAIVFAPLFLMIFVYLSSKLRTIANKHFFASVYDYQETLDKFSRDVSSTINLPEVANVVVDTIQQTMRMDNIGLFVKNKHYEPMKVIGFDEGDLQKMVSNPRCTNFISSLKKPLVYDELVRNPKNFENPQEEVEYAKEQMKSLGIAVVLPLVTKGELISCIILGKKISRDAYTQEDMKLLESLANHASISIENARLYNEIQGFNETLKYKVDDATKRLRELLKIKSDFLTVASHQLRTPTSIVRGMLSLVIEEKDLPTDERERFISQAYEGINRLERIIHELLNATELEGKKMQLDSKKVRVEEIIDEIIYGLKPLATQLKVNLTFDKPSKQLPKTVADPIKLKEAITNIVDNAVHYTAGGNVNILARRKENQIVIEVSDNGIGMTKNDLRNIFTKFTRGEGILQVHPNGTGLGLFIARKMLEAMGGTITAESKGKNKGSKFTLTIPIK